MSDDLQKYINKKVTEQNNRGLSDFEGYSPVEMQYLLYEPFDDKSPVQLLKMTESNYKAVPILNQIKYLANLIEGKGEIKLTKKGFLPTKVVADIYSQGFIKDEDIESGISKLYKETDSNIINLTRILLDISGITKKRHNKLSLTKSGRNTIHNNHKLLLLIFKTFGTKFNWGYYDGYGQNNIGQLGFGFTLVLLNKYGHEKRLDRFYAEKYFNAFPHLLNEVTNPEYETLEAYAQKPYSLRTFDRFLNYFGLIKIEAEKKWDADKYISKTKIFDKLIKCEHHKNA